MSLPATVPLTKTVRIEKKQQRFNNDIIIIGNEGRMTGESTNDEKDQKLLKIVNSHKNSKASRGVLNFIEDGTLIEIEKHELPEEMINPDIQYFLAFCSFLYFMRGLLMVYCLLRDLDDNKLNFEHNYDLIIYLADILFTIVLFSTSINGFLFCWTMYLWFAFPYLMSLFLSTSLMCFRTIAPIVDKEYRLDPHVKTAFTLNILKNMKPLMINESVIDSGFLLLNLFTSFCMTILYKQIGETQRALEYEPEVLEIDGNEYKRIKYLEEIVYRLKDETKFQSLKTKSKSIKTMTKTNP